MLPRPHGPRRENRTTHDPNKRTAEVRKVVRASAICDVDLQGSVDEVQRLCARVCVCVRAIEQMPVKYPSKRRRANTPCQNDEELYARKIYAIDVGDEDAE